MKIIIPGHKYELDMMEGGVQTIQFIQKEQRDKKFVTVNNGTTNEEVLAALIDRLEFLQTKQFCGENITAMMGLRTALNALNARTEERKHRGVEGTSAT